jgi:hypothetical protein
MKHIQGEQIADTLLFTSGVATISHYATQFQPIISDLAGLVAIVSGLFAIRFYYLKSKKYGKNYQDNKHSNQD